MHDGRGNSHFVGGDSEVDNLITRVTGGEYSHVAGYLFDSVYESTGIKESDDPYPGVWLHSPRKYEGHRIVRTVVVEVPDMESLQDEARRLIGRPYAYLGCIEGGLYDKLGIKISIASAFAVNCSETWARLLRAGGVDILPEVPVDCITPADLFKAVVA